MREIPRIWTDSVTFIAAQELTPVSISNVGYTGCSAGSTHIAETAVEYTQECLGPLKMTELSLCIDY